VLYEAGRYQDVVSRVSAMPPDAASPRELWFAGQSYVSLGQQAEAQATFERLQTSGDDAWRATARLAAATVSGDGAAIDAARGAAAAHPGHPFAQYQLGVALMRQGALADAAAALDRSAAADPTLAYAYYYAGLAYQKLNRPDVMANRFDTFLRLAPNAPQRPEVQAIMTTLRG
jgi:tetratricopeptide (TPR) repeat protein